MAIRDVLQAIQAAIVAVSPPGVSAVLPGTGNLGTGTISFDPSSKGLGTFLGLLQVLSPTTAQLSLDNGVNYGVPFTIPTSPATFSVPLDPPTGMLSGLVLTFSGSFASGDTYSFLVSAPIEFQTGEEWTPEQSIWPRVVWVPLGDQFAGTQDYALGADQRTQPRALYTAVARFQTYLWGADYQRAELLRDQVLNGFRTATYATIQVESGSWVLDDSSIERAGRAYTLFWNVPKPVLELAQLWQTVLGPFTEVNTPAVDH